MSSQENRRRSQSANLAILDCWCRPHTTKFKTINKNTFGNSLRDVGKTLRIGKSRDSARQRRLSAGEIGTARRRHWRLENDAIEL
jgi:hypothetical protein